MNKKDIRAAIREQNKLLDKARKCAEAEIVTNRLKQLIHDKQPAVVAAFMPMPDEIAIDIKSLSALCRLLIPRITLDNKESAEMEFFDYTPEDIGEGAYGIHEPQGNTPVAAEHIDMMIVPGVAFTPEGCRLGRGKGFYDRYTARNGFRALCVGVCMRHQLIDSLPTEKHDRKMDIVITAEQ